VTLSQTHAWALVTAAACAVACAAADEVKVSYCFRGDSVAAINDGVEPKTPRDQPHHSFWPHKGTDEWAEYHFDRARRVRATEVYWLDDTPAGRCPVPASWRLLYRRGDRWVPVEDASPFGVEKGVFNRVTFKEVETTALRIEVRSRPGRGSGIMEWDVRDDPKVVEARRARRLLARLDAVAFAPPQNALVGLMERTETLSHQARKHLARLDDLRRQRDAIGEGAGQGGAGRSPRRATRRRGRKPAGRGGPPAGARRLLHPPPALAAQRGQLRHLAERAGALGLLDPGL